MGAMTSPVESILLSDSAVDGPAFAGIGGDDPEVPGLFLGLLFDIFQCCAGGRVTSRITSCSQTSR